MLSAGRRGKAITIRFMLYRKKTDPQIEAAQERMDLLTESHSAREHRRAGWLIPITDLEKASWRKDYLRVVLGSSCLHYLKFPLPHTSPYSLAKEQGWDNGRILRGAAGTANAHS